MTKRPRQLSAPYGKVTSPVNWKIIYLIDVSKLPVEMLDYIRDQGAAEFTYSTAKDGTRKYKYMAIEESDFDQLRWYGGVIYNEQIYLRRDYYKDKDGYRDTRVFMNDRKSPLPQQIFTATQRLYMETQKARFRDSIKNILRYYYDGGDHELVFKYDVDVE